MCPKADDPITVDQNDRAIGIIVQSHSHSLPLEGSVGITLYGETSFISLSYPSNEDCQYALQNSTQIGTVVCNYTVITPYRRVINVTFTSWPLISDNNVFSNDGDPSITDFYCDISQSADSRLNCSFYDIVNTDLKGIAFCMYVCMYV